MKFGYLTNNSAGGNRSGETRVPLCFPTVKLPGRHQNKWMLVIRWRFVHIARNIMISTIKE